MNKIRKRKELILFNDTSEFFYFLKCPVFCKQNDCYVKEKALDNIQNLFNHFMY